MLIIKRKEIQKTFQEEKKKLGQFGNLTHASWELFIFFHLLVFSEGKQTRRRSLKMLLLKTWLGHAKLVSIPAARRGHTDDILVKKGSPADSCERNTHPLASKIHFPLKIKLFLSRFRAVVKLYGQIYQKRKKN